MPFVPVNAVHSITEVVFGLIFERPFDQAESAAFNNSHSEFQAELPGKLQMAGAPFLVNGQPIPMQFGAVFDRYSPAGALEKRLRMDGSAIYVNNLVYTRWDEVSTNAQELISKCVAQSLKMDNVVRSILLQYIDVFRWEGDPRKYDLSQLLDKNSVAMTNGIFEHGPLWHLHQGWYNELAQDISGKLLERTTIDGVMDSTNAPVVRIDSFLQLELTNGIASRDYKFENAAWVEVRKFFDFLHLQNKSLLANCLTPGMRKEIGL